MTPCPSADGRVRRGCLFPGSNTGLGTPCTRADACAPGAAPSTDSELAALAAVGETVLRLLLLHRVRARARGLLVYGSEHLSRLAGLLAQLRIGSLPDGGLPFTGTFPRQTQVPCRSET